MELGATPKGLRFFHSPFPEDAERGRPVLKAVVSCLEGCSVLVLAIKGSGLPLLPAAPYTGLSHHLSYPPGAQPCLLPLPLEGSAPAGHQGSVVEGNHRLAGHPGRPRPLARSPSFAGLRECWVSIRGLT